MTGVVTRIFDGFMPNQKGLALTEAAIIKNAGHPVLLREKYKEHQDAINDWAQYINLTQFATEGNDRTLQTVGIAAGIGIIAGILLKTYLLK